MNQEEEEEEEVDEQRKGKGGGREEEKESYPKLTTSDGWQQRLTGCVCMGKRAHKHKT